MPKDPLTKVLSTPDRKMFDEWAGTEALVNKSLPSKKRDGEVVDEVLYSESEELYRLLLAGLVDDWGSSGAVELMLLRQVAQGYLKLRRAEDVERGMLEENFRDECEKFRDNGKSAKLSDSEKWRKYKQLARTSF